MLGLTMRHSRAHVWRAFLEATCLGTRAAIEAMVSAGHSAKEITVCGGACQSDTWLQLHADVTGLPVVSNMPDALALSECIFNGYPSHCTNITPAFTLPPPCTCHNSTKNLPSPPTPLLFLDTNQIIGECPDGPLLGCACLAASAAGMFESPAAASTAFFRRARRIEPDPEAVRAYDQVFAAYQTCVTLTREISHTLAGVAGS
mmetsp:Transcript_34169/g.89966  ORF Transcript_34169/g.89966 Transcript_34169/m.89966 type:complete len:203 (-) Transcript_34169:703-1311(-)